MDFENQPMTEKEFLKVERKEKNKNHKLRLVGNVLALIGFIVRFFIEGYSYLGFDLGENEGLYSLGSGLIALVGVNLNLIGVIRTKKEYEEYLENYNNQKIKDGN